MLQPITIVSVLCLLALERPTGRSQMKSMECSAFFFLLGYGISALGGGVLHAKYKNNLFPRPVPSLRILGSRRNQCLIQGGKFVVLCWVFLQGSSSSGEHE